MDMEDSMKRNNIYITGKWEGAKKEQGIENLVEKVVTENFPNLRKSHTSPRSTEGRNQEEPKEAHSKTHHNKNGKL